MCARRALASLGLPPAPLVPGRRGLITWPGGVSGSMTTAPASGRRPWRGPRSRRPWAWTRNRTCRCPPGSWQPSPGRARRPRSPGRPGAVPMCTGTGCCSAPRSRCSRPGLR
ncbi:hypothetical protein AB0F25_24620 [Streptomyces wedmorensis]